MGLYTVIVKELIFAGFIFRGFANFYNFVKVNFVFRQLISNIAISKHDAVLILVHINYQIRLILCLYVIQVTKAAFRIFRYLKPRKIDPRKINSFTVCYMLIQLVWFLFFSIPRLGFLFFSHPRLRFFLKSAIQKLIKHLFSNFDKFDKISLIIQRGRGMQIDLKKGLILMGSYLF